MQKREQLLSEVWWKHCIWILGIDSFSKSLFFIEQTQKLFKGNSNKLRYYTRENKTLHASVNIHKHFPHLAAKARLKSKLYQHLVLISEVESCTFFYILKRKHADF